MPDHHDYYVYALLLEDSQTPFYIGKGRGHRVRAHSRRSENMRGKGPVREEICLRLIDLDPHPSEAQIDDLEVDADILNDGTIEHLHMELWHSLESLQS